jgi:D-alanine--poly(phosphoribitol) ligase subunit 1
VDREHPFEYLLQNLMNEQEKIFLGDSETEISKKQAIDLIDRISLLIEEQLDTDDQNVGIAIDLPRNHYYLATIFAIWQLGHYFIPLNIKWPVTHLQTIVKKAQPALVVSNEVRTEYKTLQFKDLEKTRLVDEEVKQKWQIARRQSEIAYLIFTSGSTGEQKGVLISHEAYDTYLEWTKEYFINFRHNRSLLITAELTFDITLGDIAFAIVHDVAIHISPDPKNVFWHAKLIMDRKIDTFYSVPSTIKRLFTWAINRRDVTFEHMKLIVSGGDTFSPDLIKIVKQNSPDAEFHNVYGPTEVTINCFATRVDHILERITEGNNLVPIGFPFPHLETKLLNAENENHGGVLGSGELLVAGTQIMNGYIGEPELTDNVFRVEFGKKFYYTGDLVIRDKEGYHYVMGRVDSLVKVKGYRINPAEIDGILEKELAVKEAKTVTFREEECQQAIVSFVVLTSKDQEVISQLLESCKIALPGYMVPYEIVAIDQIPIGKSGKYDSAELKNNYLDRNN